jgi:hypothetical protein
MNVGGCGRRESLQLCRHTNLQQEFPQVEVGIGMDTRDRHGHVRILRGVSVRDTTKHWGKALAQATLWGEAAQQHAQNTDASGQKTAVDSTTYNVYDKHHRDDGMRASIRAAREGGGRRHSKRQLYDTTEVKLGSYHEHTRRNRRSSTVGNDLSRLAIVIPMTSLMAHLHADIQDAM